MTFPILPLVQGEPVVPETTIVEIGKAELPRVRTLAFLIWPEAYAGILPAANIGPMLDDIYQLETLEADLEVRKHRYWLATVDGKDAGFVSAYRDGDRAWIKKIYVLASLRGLSLGKRLIEAALAGFPGVKSVGLYVNDGNARAIGFYKSQGFAIEATVPVRMGGFDYTDYAMAKLV